MRTNGVTTYNSSYTNLYRITNSLASWNNTQTAGSLDLYGFPLFFVYISSTRNLILSLKLFSPEEADLTRMLGYRFTEGSVDIFAGWICTFFSQEGKELSWRCYPGIEEVVPEMGQLSLYRDCFLSNTIGNEPYETASQQTGTNKHEKLSFREKISYALCDVAINPLCTLLVSFLTFFYTDILGVNVASVGVIIGISKVFDGITDVLAGQLIDHTHTPAGSARPWIFRMAIPVGLSYVALFAVPNINEAGKLIYLFVSYNVVSSVVYTIAGVAQNALPAFMTRDQNDRSVLYVYRMLIACVAQLLTALYMLKFVRVLGGGQMGWIKASAILGTIGIIAYFLCYFGTKERYAPIDENCQNVPLFLGLKSLFKNKYWLILVGRQFCTNLHQIE